MHKHAEIPNAARLNVAVCTYGADGMKRFAATKPPQVNGVCYIVSWQNSEDAEISAELSERKDVLVYRTGTIGLSANRNNALKHCQAPYILIADDDILYRAESLLKLIDTLETHPQTDIAVVKLDIPGAPLYPVEDMPLGKRLPKGLWIISCGMVLKRESTQSLKFDTRLGLGAPLLTSGEEEYFYYQAQKKGLNCHYFPIEIGKHPQHSTGTSKRLKSGTVMAMGLIISLQYGTLQSLLRLPLKAMRMKRNSQAPFFKSLLWLYRGAKMKRQFYNS